MTRSQDQVNVDGTLNLRLFTCLLSSHVLIGRKYILNNLPDWMKTYSTLLGTTIDKVYIDGSCGSKIITGILLARLKRVGYLYKENLWV